MAFEDRQIEIVKSARSSKRQCSARVDQPRWLIKHGGYVAGQAVIKNNPEGSPPLYFPKA